MADQTVTIQGNFTGDIAQRAAENAAAVRSLTDAVSQGGTQAAGAATKLGESLDKASTKTKTASTTADYLSKSMKELKENVNQVHEGINHFGEAITEKMTYPMQQFTWAVEGAVAGLVGFGLASYNNLQQANLQLTTFTGSAVKGTAAYKALLALRDPASMGELTNTFETLSTVGGETQNQALRQTRILANASAPYGAQSGAMMATGSNALAQINARQGMDITNAQVLPLAKLFPQIYSILGKEQGISSSQVATNLARGAAYDDPNLVNQLGATPQASNGRAAEAKTFGGQIEGLKTSIGDVLASAETPLAIYLGKYSDRIHKWADDTTARFQKLGGTLFAELGKHDMGGFQNTLSTILGSKEAAKDITLTINLVETLGKVMTDVVLPGFKDVAKVAMPLLQFFASHRTTTEMLVIALGGLVVLNKVAGFAVKSYEAFLLLKKLWEGMQGVLDVLTAKQWLYNDSLLATNTRTETLIAEDETLATVSGGAGGGAALPVALAVTDVLAQRQQSKADPKTPTHILGTKIPSGHVSDTRGPGLLSMMKNGDFDNRHLEHYGSDIVHAPGAIISGIGGLFGGHHHSSSASAGNTTNVHGNVNITVPGSGNPEKVANSIPKGLNANINANAARQARRTGKVLTQT